MPEPARLSLEDELVAVLAAPIEGSVAAAYQRKEVALRAVLARLPAAECRVLAARLRCVCPGDPLASLFGRMTAERRGRLLAYLDDARRREAVRAASAPRAKAGAAAEALVAPALGAPGVHGRALGIDARDRAVSDRDAWRLSLSGTGSMLGVGRQGRLTGDGACRGRLDARSPGCRDSQSAEARTGPGGTDEENERAAKKG